MKTLTSDQLKSRKEKAARFVRDVLGDDERADEIANESLEDYADRRKIRIANPQGGNMAVRSLKKGGRKTAETQTAAAMQPAALQNPHEARLLRQQIDDLERENETLQDQLDKVADIASAPKDEESLTADDLKEKMNEILDVAAPGEAEDVDEDDDTDEE